MKQFLIKLLIDYILDALEAVLNDLSRKSGNTIDDQVVEVMTDNRDQIKEMIKTNL